MALGQNTESEVTALTLYGFVLILFVCVLNLPLAFLSINDTRNRHFRAITSAVQMIHGMC